MCTVLKKYQWQAAIHVYLIEEVSMAGGNTCVPYRRSINDRRQYM